MLKLILPSLLALIFCANIGAKVEAPNYQFKLETLDVFMPGQKVEDIEKQHGKGVVMNDKRGTTTIKFKVKQIRYSFDVLVQAREGVVLDFFTKLPSYFLHDVFFQSLINKYGKQTSYKKAGEEAYYVWEKAPLKIIYNGHCTITCFPGFYTAYPLEIPNDKPFTPQITQMQKAMRR